MKPSQATQGDGEFFNDVTFRRALKSFEYKLFADSSMSSPVYIYIYIYMVYVYIYGYIYTYTSLLHFSGMYSWILYLYLLALPVGKLWKWNARHVPRKSLRLRRNAGAFDGWRPLSMNPKVILAMQNIRKLHKLCTVAKKYHMPYFGTAVQWYFQSYLVTCPINKVLGFRLLVA